MLLAFAVPTVVLETVLYNGPAPVPGSGLPVIWVFAEDNTYFGYSLPRIEALAGRTWLAVIVVSFFTALQHVFLPLRLEWQWLLSHFLGYVLGAAVTCLFYMRIRRLLPLHIAHWVVNIIGVLMVLLSTMGR